MRILITLIVAVVLVVVLLAFLSPGTQMRPMGSVATTDITSAAAKEDGADIPFVPGGTVAMELHGADYRVIPSANDHITITYRTNPMNVGNTSIRAGVKGSHASVIVETPSGNGIHVEIGVPAKTNLVARMTAGNLVINGVEGSKDVEANAGNVVLDVVNANQYGPVYASVTSGNLSADPWSTHKGGLLRSFSTNGPGKYGLRVHVGAGNLTLTERSILK
jgi:hypothetical protein